MAFGFLIAVSCNNNEPAEKKASAVPSKSYTILLSGIPPAPLYSNALDIVSAKTHITFIWAAGCFVSERLGDSIDKVNSQTFSELKKDGLFANEESLYNRVEEEYKYLQALDSTLKKLNSPADTLTREVYYSHFPGIYKVYYYEADSQKTRIFSTQTFDSASGKIMAIKQKDTLVNNLSDLNK